MSSSKYTGVTGGLIKDLFSATREGNIERLALGLSRDSSLLDVPYMMFKGTRTLLGEAAMYGRVSSIAFLLSQGADDRKRDLDGYTPLQLACLRGHTGAAELLLREGNHRAVTISMRDSQGNNALQLAIKAGNADTAHWLIQLNIFDLAARNGYGDTALHLAIRKQSVAIVQSLLDAGADATVPDGDGRSPLDLASSYQSDPVANLVHAAAMNAQHGYHVAQARAILNSASAFTTYKDAVAHAFATSPALYAQHSAELRTAAVNRKRNNAAADEGAGDTTIARATGKRVRPNRAIVVPAHVDSLFDMVDPALHKRVLAQTAPPTLRVLDIPVQKGNGVTARKREEATRKAMLEFVIKELPQELFTELMEGFEEVPVLTRPERVVRRRGHR